MSLPVIMVLCPCGPLVFSYHSTVFKFLTPDQFFYFFQRGNFFKALNYSLKMVELGK